MCLDCKYALNSHYLLHIKGHLVVFDWNDFIKRALALVGQMDASLVIFESLFFSENLVHSQGFISSLFSLINYHYKILPGTLILAMITFGFVSHYE